MGIALRNASNPVVMDYIKPYLLPDNDLIDGAENTVEACKRLISNNPDLILVIVATDDDDTLHGFCIAVAPPQMRYALVEQVWCSVTGQKFDLASRFLDHIKIWAKQRDRTKLRMESSHDPNGFVKKYDFKPISTTMELVFEDYKVIEEINTDIVSEDVDNGTLRRRTENNIGPIGLSERDRQETGTLHKGEAAEQSGVVSGSADSGIAKPILEGDAVDPGVGYDSLRPAYKISSGPGPLGEAESS